MAKLIGRYAILFGLALGLNGVAQATELRPFVTDGCTYYPDGSVEHPKLWLDCCIGHDLALWGGGTTAEHDATDLRLRDCVAATGADEEAQVMYLGIRIGAQWPVKVSGNQWGNAWDPHITRSASLSASEIDELLAEIAQPQYDAVIPPAQRKLFVDRLLNQKKVQELAEGIRPFVTDGCTDWPDGTKENPTQWRHCCVDHDLSLWAGGSQANRDSTDLRLRACVAATGAKDEAEVIYLGVRVASKWPWKYGMQWGNAWSAHRTRKTALSALEIAALESEILKPVYESAAPLAQREALVARIRAENPKP
jgi:hypothetical protein